MSQRRLLIFGRSAQVVQFLLWLVPLGFLISSGWVLWQAHWPGVYVDMWDELPFLQRLEQGQSTLSDWLNAYALSHRLLLPRWVFAAEHLWFRHANVFSLMVSLLAHAAAFAVLALWVKRESGMRAETRRVAWCLLAATAVSALHLHNLLYPFLVQWFLVVALVLLAIACLAGVVQATGRVRHRGLMAAWVLVVLASFCTASGTVALLVLAASALVLRLGRSGGVFALACLLVLAAQVLAPTGHPPAEIIWARLGIEQRTPDFMTWLWHCLDFLGMPLTLLSPTLGRLLGAIVLAYAGWHAWRLCRHGPQQQPPLALVCLLALGWFCVNAAAVGYGRAVFEGTAVDSRFHTLHLWPLPLLLIHQLSIPASGAWQSRMRLVLPAIWVLGVLLPLQAPALTKNLQQADRVRLAHIAYALDLRGWQTHALLSVPHRLLGENPALQWRDHLKATQNGVFARPEVRRMEQGLSLPEGLSICDAVLTWQAGGRGSVAFQVVIPDGQPLPEAVWILDAEQRIIGWASPELPSQAFARPARLSGHARRVSGPAQMVMEHPPCHRAVEIPGG